jgi:hypothetical protein
MGSSRTSQDFRPGRLRSDGAAPARRRAQLIWAVAIGLLLSVALTDPSAAQEGQEAGPHHLSAVIGGTHIPHEDETAFTLGLDYEYRLNKTLGLGFVAEHAFGPVSSTTLLAVADIHVAGGFAIQTGPGVEFVDDESFFVTRLGALYEFEIGEAFTLSPQLHYDFSTGDDAIVFGIAIGKAF